MSSLLRLINVFLYATFLFILNHLSFKNFITQFPKKKKNRAMYITSFSPKQTGHLPLYVLLVTLFNCHIPSSSHAITFLSFLDHHSRCNVLPQLNFTRCVS